MATSATSFFSLTDYLVLATVLTLSSLIGLYYRSPGDLGMNLIRVKTKQKTCHRFSGGRQKTSREYLLADGRMTVMEVQQLHNSHVRPGGARGLLPHGLLHVSHHPAGGQSGELYIWHTG